MWHYKWQAYHLKNVFLLTTSHRAALDCGYVIVSEPNMLGLMQNRLKLIGSDQNEVSWQGLLLWFVPLFPVNQYNQPVFSPQQSVVIAVFVTPRLKSFLVLRCVIQHHIKVLCRCISCNWDWAAGNKKPLHHLGTKRPLSSRPQASSMQVVL